MIEQIDGFGDIICDAYWGAELMAAVAERDAH